MKRHQSIAPLSREHHFGLLFCWKIRQGLKKRVPSGRMKPYVDYFWINHLVQHFEEEERLLFPALEDSLCGRATAEHQQIRQLVEVVSIEDPVSPDKLHLLADSLEKHIRFEERILFPKIEKELSDDALMNIWFRLKLSVNEVPKDNYHDEFWI